MGAREKILFWRSKKNAAEPEEELGEILGEIVLNEANKLRIERHEFYRRLVQDEADAQGLMRALIKELETSLNGTRGLEQDIRQLKAEISEVRARKDNGTAQEYQREINDSKWDQSKKIEEYDDMIKGLVKNISLLERAAEESKHELENNESEVQTLKHRNEIQRKEMQRAHEIHEKAQSSLQENHNAEKARLQEALDAKREAVQRLQKEKDRMQNKHDSEQRQMRKEFDVEEARLKRESEAKMVKMEQEHNFEQKRLKNEFEAKKTQLGTAHAAETKRLRRDIEAYSKDLLARDDFEPMPDNEIKARFLDLAQEIDTLARLEWKPNQKEWISQVLRHLPGNQRLLKKQILQDSVWVILHENIFCSPFRVFGEEGWPLESQWSDEYGKDSQPDNGSYVWPQPSIDAERWRYATIKECRAALEKPVSEWDPRARLRKGFKTSLDTLMQELTSTLGEVSNLDKSNVQAAGSIIKKAAKMWLEFGMQRCRILVIVQGSNLGSVEERIQRAREATLELVVVPELKRFGNSKGQDVHIEETVGGCDGEMVAVSMTR